jgi:DNA processing protein
MITEVKRDDIRFPYLLKEIRQSPEQIFCRGRMELLGSRCVAVVGSRKCTQYGVTVAKSIGRRLAQAGITVVSGMARGIDSAAHEGALEAGGNTIAVFGCGVDMCFPAENRGLMKKIIENGLVISEYPPGTKPVPFNFPQRNRIISGISESTVVVEAAARSGSLITAEFAAEQSRNVYAVPGNITSGSSFGSNKLIREGVTPLILIDDIITDIGIVPVIDDKTYYDMGDDEILIYDIVKKYGEVSYDEICAETSLSPARISGIITVMEMKGLVATSMGKVFIDKITY